MTEQAAADNTVNRQRGFTLIELLVVVAIVSILAVIAMATYSDYVVRSKVSEGMLFAAEAKTSVTDYYYSMQKFPRNNGQAGLSAAASYDQYEFIRKLEVSPTAPYGVITITFKLPGTQADNRELQLIPSTRDGLLSWTCRPSPDNGIDPTQVPSSCRG